MYLQQLIRLIIGAIPDDGIDDSIAVREAIADACVGDHSLILEGMFNVKQEPNKLGNLNISACVGLKVDTIGNAGFIQEPRQNTITSYDNYLINIDQGSEDISFNGVVFDGQREQWSGTAEQVHLVRSYIASDLVFNNCTFKNSFGAGTKFISTENIHVANNRFFNLGRGGVEGHSNNVGLRITGNSFYDIVDQHISSEGGGGNADWNISNNTHGPHGTGTLLVYDLSNGLTNFIVDSNTIVDGGVQLYHTESFTFSNNNIRSTWAGAPTLVYLKGKNSYGTISGNQFYSAGTDNEIYCLRIAGSDNVRDPRNLTITGNNCRHAGPQGISVVSGEGRINIVGNVVESLASKGGTGILVGQLLNKNQRGVVISSNTIINEDTGIAVSAAACTACSIGDISINANVVHSVKSGSKGFYSQVWNHSPYFIPWPINCRGDANIFDVTGAKWTTTGTTLATPPGLGCIQHGDLVPN